MPTVPVSEIHAKADSREKLLRAAMGVRSPGQAQGHSRSGWCNADGCRIAWEQTSVHSRQPVVCLHGAGSGSREFRPLLDRAPAGAKLICFDWPGHGRSGEMQRDRNSGAPGVTIDSGVSILESLLRELHIEKPILLGSGFGAAVAIRFAADNPGRVLGLILSQPAGLVPPADAGPFAHSGKWAGKRAIQRLLRRAQQSAPGSAADASAAATGRQILRLAALGSAMQAARETARASLESSAAGLRTALETLSCPALFALSRHNREYSLRRYLALLDPSLAWAPQHQFTVFAGAFQPHWDEPDRFAQAVTGFVQSLLPFENHTHAWLIGAVDYPARNLNTWKCVHPDCGQEKVLPVGGDPNQSPRG